jgi:homocysteine S-methyltransferase
MTKYRDHLPQLQNRLFSSDGGLETTLVFHEGIDLPHLAAFDLLKDDAGRRVLRDYYVRYIELARANRMGIVLETPTWRASRDWGARLGYDETGLARANRKAVDLLVELRGAYESAHTPIVVSGNLGPRGDGYSPTSRMTAPEAEDYHAEQIGTFARTDADMVAAFTINYVEEAIGIAAAAREQALPVVISFTLETDGRLPAGATLEAAIAQTDVATAGYPAY